MMNRSNTFYKVASVLIAISLWVYVVVQQNPAKTEVMVDIPVNLINMESLTNRDLVISGETQFKVNVKVKGKRSDIIKVKPEEILAKADVNDFSVGKNYIPVMVIVPDNLQLVEAKPAKIMVTIEDLVAEGKGVKVNLVGTVTGGAEVKSLSTQPEIVEVSGPKSAVNEVTHIRANVDTGRIKSGASSMSIPAEPVNAKGEVVHNVKLSLPVIEVSFRYLETREVPLQVPINGSLDAAYELVKIDKPTIVQIKGEKNALDKIVEIACEPIDLRGITAHTNVALKPVLPEGIELVAPLKKAVIEVKLIGISNKTFEYNASEVFVEGLASNLRAEIQTSSLQVKISGEEALLSQFSKSDFQPYLQLSDAGVTTDKADVKVRHDKQIASIEVIPNQMKLTIREVE